MTKISCQAGCIVITTIQKPTPAVELMAEKADGYKLQLIVVGDLKTPSDAWMPRNGIKYISLLDQNKLGYKLTDLLPKNHYSRKNIGYLLAIRNGAQVIFDTDDDNAPMVSWTRRENSTSALLCNKPGWINAYQWFTEEHIWPRGFPLEWITNCEVKPGPGLAEVIRAPIQQGLANGSPDVDAIWRLVFEKEIVFLNKDSIMLQAGVWCPFNSQSTWWFPEVYPLMYLPSFVSFRMTDIWRSFIAQRCLWELGLGVVFNGPEVFQDRNYHDLMSDFNQEIPGYLGNAKLCTILEKTQLSSSPSDIGHNLYRCYETLIKEEFIPINEMPLLEAWLSDLE